MSPIGWEALYITGIVFAGLSCLKSLIDPWVLEAMPYNDKDGYFKVKPGIYIGNGVLLVVKYIFLFLGIALGLWLLK